MNHSPVSFTENPENIEFAASVIDPIREPVLIINAEEIMISANAAFYSQFHFDLEEIQGYHILEFREELWNLPQLRNFLSLLKTSESTLRDHYVLLRSTDHGEMPVSLNGGRFKIPGEGEGWFMLNFGIAKEAGSEITYRKLLNEILSEAPAFLCILRGPEHIFELVNEKYLQLVAHRHVIGKKVKDALPEVENQGFIEILDNVYRSGEAFVGKEVALDLYQRDRTVKQSLLDFVYQPIKNAAGEVDGIFVHAIDVTEKVSNRKILEESEQELRNLIDTVPAIVWLSSATGEAYFLNENWYNYTGQSREESYGIGWLAAVHPDERDLVEKEVFGFISREEEIYQTYRLKNAKGEYRWVINRGKPRYTGEGALVGYVGSVVDVHEERIKEQVIREKEFRTRSIVEEATIATAVYLGNDFKIEFANDAMINLWGKDRTVVGKTLEEALPELEGQPFLDLLRNVITTGETYWGKEDRVDLMKNGKMETGFFNFTYKPLRNQQGEIYGILNMALDVSEMVESKNLLKEREKHYRLMADLMPEKVINTDAKGEAIYFNRNWLEYSGLSSMELKQQNWKSLIYSEDRQQFERSWRKSLETGNSFEMELRIKDRDGEYLWHLSRAEAVHGEDGEITMWIGTNTEIQKIKEEEKRKGDFLKMVSHELKTPVTSIKGYIQLLLNILRNEEDGAKPALPLRPSLERIDSQIGRLTRLISEMLDLSRLEENKLELKKEVFSINELVEETVQDIRLTNNQHQINIFHKDKGEVLGDKDRIGQVLINFITNAIKYSPESQYIEIHIYRPAAGEIAVSVKDKGIGISMKDQKHIFKRFYRIGGDSEDTYSGFGIGLYLANEIIQRHKGKILVDSRKGQGSDFSFVLSTVSE